MKMKVFVTGGHGFIGSVVVRALLAEGHTVRCLVREGSKTERIDGLAWERATGDVRDPACVAKAMEGCDGAIHLASLSNWNDIDSPLMKDVVEGGTRHILDAAAKTGARVVFVSSVLAVAGATTPQVFDESAAFTLPDAKLSYSRSKRAAEALCVAAHKERGVPVVIVNPTEVYGPNDTALITACNLIDFAKSSPVLVCTGGTSVVHVDDVARGIVRALEKGRPGERYILGGDNLTIKQLAALTLELLGQKKSIWTMPNGLLRGLATVGKALKLPLPFNPHVIPYATLYWFVRNDKARRELGVEFRSARETLAPTLTWLRESGRIGGRAPQEARA
jgi:dihydroflavonol-4-reductase